MHAYVRFPPTYISLFPKPNFFLSGQATIPKSLIFNFSLCLEDKILGFQKTPIEALITLCQPPRSFIGILYVHLHKNLAFRHTSFI